MMKKILVVLLLMVSFSSVSFSQNTIRTFVVDNHYRYIKGDGWGFTSFLLSKDGSFKYEKVDNSGNYVKKGEGTYHIDEKNVVHMRWENGYNETCTISYDSRDRIVLTHKSVKYYEVLDTD